MKALPFLWMRVLVVVTWLPQAVSDMTIEVQEVSADHTESGVPSFPAPAAEDQVIVQPGTPVPGSNP